MINFSNVARQLNEGKKKKSSPARPKSAAARRQDKADEKVGKFIYSQKKKAVKAGKQARREYKTVKRLSKSIDKKVKSGASENTIKSEMSKRKAHNIKGDKYAKKSKRLISSIVASTPMGSSTYSKASDPTGMNAKFRSHLKTTKGRREIGSRLRFSESNNPALAASASSAEKALNGGQNQITKTNDRKNRQKAQMATQRTTANKSDISYVNEGSSSHQGSDRAHPDNLNRELQDRGHTDLKYDKKPIKMKKHSHLPLKATTSDGKVYDTDLGQIKRGKGGTGGSHTDGKFSDSFWAGGHGKAKDQLRKMDAAVASVQGKKPKLSGKQKELISRMDRAGSKENLAKKAAEHEEKSKSLRLKRTADKAIKDIRGSKTKSIRGKGSKANRKFDSMSEQRSEIEYIKMYESQSSDWRTELIEAAGVDEEGNHPYVDVMPMMNQKAMEAKKQLKTAKMASMEGGKQAMQAESTLNEEDYDRVKDERMMSGGVTGNQRSQRSTKPNLFGKGKPGDKYASMSKYKTPEAKKVDNEMEITRKHNEKNPPKSWKPGAREKQRAAQDLGRESAYQKNMERKYKRDREKNPAPKMKKSDPNDKSWDVKNTKEDPWAAAKAFAKWRDSSK